MELQEQVAAVVEELHTHKGASPRELGLKHVPSLERHDRSAPHVEQDVTLHTWDKEHHLANVSKGEWSPHQVALGFAKERVPTNVCASSTLNAQKCTFINVCSELHCRRGM